jgi:hypothetical protein
VKRFGIEGRVPKHLGVDVGMSVDEPRRDERTLGVQLFLSVRSKARLHFHDAAVSHPHVGLLTRRPSAVHDHSTSDQNVVIHAALLLAASYFKDLLFTEPRGATTSAKRQE